MKRSNNDRDRISGAIEEFECHEDESRDKEKEKVEEKEKMVRRKKLKKKKHKKKRRVREREQHSHPTPAKAVTCTLECVEDDRDEADEDEEVEVVSSPSMHSTPSNTVSIATMSPKSAVSTDLSHAHALQTPRKKNRKRKKERKRRPSDEFSLDRDAAEERKVAKRKKRLKKKRKQNASKATTTKQKAKAEQIVAEKKSEEDESVEPTLPQPTDKSQSQSPSQSQSDGDDVEAELEAEVEDKEPTDREADEDDDDDSDESEFVDTEEEIWCETTESDDDGDDIVPAFLFGANEETECFEDLETALFCEYIDEDDDALDAYSDSDESGDGKECEAELEVESPVRPEDIFTATVTSTAAAFKAAKSSAKSESATTSFPIEISFESTEPTQLTHPESEGTDDVRAEIKALLRRYVLSRDEAEAFLFVRGASDADKARFVAECVTTYIEYGMLDDVASLYAATEIEQLFGREMYFNSTLQRADYAAALRDFADLDALLCANSAALRPMAKLLVLLIRDETMTLSSMAAALSEGQCAQCSAICHATIKHLMHSAHGQTEQLKAVVHEARSLRIGAPIELAPIFADLQLDGARFAD